MNVLIDKEIYKSFKQRNSNVSAFIREKMEQEVRKNFEEPKLPKEKVRINLHISDELWAEFVQICKLQNKFVSHEVEKWMTKI